MKWEAGKRALLRINMLLRDWLGRWRTRIGQRKTFRGSFLVINELLKSPKMIRVVVLGIWEKDSFSTYFCIPWVTLP